MSRSSPPTAALATPLSSSSRTTSAERQQESNTRAFNYLEDPRFTYYAGDSAQASTQLILSDVSPYFVEAFNDQHVVVGDKVSLKCIAGGTPLPMITWTLDGLPFDERKQKSDTNTLQTAMWGDFVVFGKGQVVSHINMTAQSVYDGGHYDCTASNTAGRIIHSGYVSVAGQTEIREMQNKSAIAMQSIILPCYTIGEKPTLLLWRKDGELVPFNHRQRIHKNGSLEISNLDQTIDSGKYTCIAVSHKDAKAFVQQSVTLQVKVPPVIEEFKFSSRLQAGMRTRVSCNVAQGDQPVQLRWLKDGKNITGGVIKGLAVNKADQFSMAVIIENLSSYHNGNYTCSASNDAATVSHTTQLLVNVPPIWVIEPKNAMVVEGNAVTIDCVADGYPIPQIVWKHLPASTAKSTFAVSQQYQLIRSGPHYQVYENGTLRISKSRISDRGSYLCQATNGIGSGLSIVVQLTVNVPVRFEHWDKLENVTVVKGRSVQMVCKVIGDQPITLQWKRNSHVVQTASEPRYFFDEQNTENGLVSTLNISSASRIDSTVFKCIAINAFGMDTKKVFLTVEESPEAPLNIQVESKSSRSIALKWEQAFNGNSRVTSIIVSLKRRKAGHKSKDEYSNITVTGNETTALIRNLHPSTKYSIVLFAINSIGTSKQSEAIEVITEDEAPEGPPINIRTVAINATVIKIEWSSPRAEVINGELKGYYIGYKVYNSSDHFLYKTVPANGSHSNSLHSMLLHGLRPFTNYVIILQAFNTVGAGPRSDELVIRTLESVPSLPPTNIKCTSLSSTSVKVTWNKLAHRNVNGFLAGYKVKYKLATDVSQAQIRTEIVRDHNSFVMHGLEKFSNYSLEIAAFTSVGDGPFTENVYCTTDEDIPSGPSEIKVAVDSPDSVIVSWRPPLYPNGVIKSYTVYREDDGKVYPFTVPKHFLYHRVNGLKQRRKYSFWMKASTAVGEGASSAIVSQSITSIAEARVVTFGGRVRRRVGDMVELPCKAVGIPTPVIEWNLNGIALTKATQTDDQGIVQLMNGSLRIEKLTKTSTGNYSCHSTNAHGKDFIVFNLIVDINKAENESPFSASIKVVEVTNFSITLSWQYRDNENYAPLALELYFKPVQSESEWKHHIVEYSNNSNQTFVLKQLSCGTQYQIYVVVVTRKGKSAASEMVHVKTHGRQPLASAASAFISKINSTAVRLNLNTWKDEGCQVNEQSIKWRKSYSSHWNTLSLESIKESYLLSGLRSDTTYKVRVMMSNSAGHTIVEYEVQTSPFKIANVHRLPSDTPEHVSSTHRNEEDDSSVAPMIFTLTLILLLASTTVLAILLLHKAVQKRALFNNLNNSRRGNESKKAPSHHSTNSEVMSATGSSELSVLPSTIDRVNKHKTNAQKTVTTSLQSPESNAYQYLTIRKSSFQNPKSQQKEELYSVIQKRDGNTMTKQALCIDFSEGAMARYSAPKANPMSSSQATTPKERFQQPFAAAVDTATQEHSRCVLDPTIGRKTTDCVCCAVFEPECCGREQWLPECDFHAIIDI